MLSRIHRRFGSAGLVVSVVALIAALAGTAFAATKLNGTQKKEVKAIAKKFAGKNGAPGKDGPPGPTGPTGPAGSNGKDGTNGKDGKSIVTGNEATETTHCEERGGVWVEVEGSGVKRYVCNGASGVAGGTQTGLWSFVDKGQSSTFVSISFPQHLSTIPTVEWLPIGSFPVEHPNCPGTDQAPAAEPGFLCIYPSQVSGAGEGPNHAPRDFFSYTPDRKSGVTMEFGLESETVEAFGAGSWAVAE